MAARRRLGLQLLVLATTLVAPALCGFLFGVDGFLTAAFGIPAAAICISGIRGTGTSHNTKSWPRAGA